MTNKCSEAAPGTKYEIHDAEAAVRWWLKLDRQVSDPPSTDLARIFSVRFGREAEVYPD